MRKGSRRALRGLLWGACALDPSLSAAQPVNPVGVRLHSITLEWCAWEGRGVCLSVCVWVCGDHRVHGKDQQASNRHLSARGDRGAPPRGAQGEGWLPLPVGLERGASARKHPL